MTDSHSSFRCPNCRSRLPTFTPVPPSPVPHLLGTNKIPSNAEAINIRASIASKSLQRDRARLDDDIARTRRVLERLYSERDALTAYTNEHAAFLTIARRVPVEIWSEIFWHCMPGTMTIKDSQMTRHYNEPSELMSFNPRKAPALFLRVCRDWRTTAISTPRLWSLIDLNASSTFLSVTPTLVQTWLKRSQQAPLSMLLSNSPYIPLTFFQNPLVRTTLEQSHRWQTIYMHQWQASMGVFLPLKNNLPDLEELHVRFYAERDPLHQRASDIFLNAPKLHRVTIYGSPPYPIVDMQLPWPQLTHLSLREEKSIIALRAVLQSAPNLLALDWLLSQPYRMESGSESLTMVQHPRLLDFSVFLYSDPGSSFNCLALPALRKLSIKTSRRFEASPWKIFESFLSRNGQAVESFQLAADLADASKLTACLKILPALTDLTLAISGRVTDSAELKHLLKSLSYTGTDPFILSALQRITIICQRTASDCNILTMFIDMIESRWRLSHLYDRSVKARSKSQHKASHARIRRASFVIQLASRGTTTDLGDEDCRVPKLRAEGLAVQVSSISA